MTRTTAVLMTNQMQKQRKQQRQPQRHHRHRHPETKNENKQKQKVLLATTASLFRLLSWGVLCCCCCCCYLVILSSLHNNTIIDDFKKNTRMILTTRTTTTSDKSSSLSSSSSSRTRTPPLATKMKDNTATSGRTLKRSLEKKEQEGVDGNNNTKNHPQNNPKQQKEIQRQPILRSQQKQQLQQSPNLNEDKTTGATKSSTTTTATTATTSSSLYWDLSCPLEMSMFSGAHMAGAKEEEEGQYTTGGDELHLNNKHYAYRARKARQEVLSSSSNIMSFFQNIKNGNYWTKNHDGDTLSSNDDYVRRIYFVGDSIMRQVFISVGCLLWNDNADEDEDSSIDYVVPWFDTDRQVNMNHPNTIGAGHAHSKFEEGRVFLKEYNIELIYHYGIGRVLELQGDDYQNHESPNEGWLKSCYTRRPLTALVPKLKDSDQQRHDTTSTKKITTTSTVQRERVEISTNDVVILNAGVHSTRNSNFQNLGDLFRCKERMATATTTAKTRATAATGGKSSSSQSWPQFLYLVTGPSHFPTATGAYDRSLTRDLAAANTTTTTMTQTSDDLMVNKASSTVQKKFQCMDVTNYTVPQAEDAAFCTEHNIPIVGLNTLPKQRLNGALHVGSGDCLHWLQPGIPDLVATEIFQYLLSSSK